MEGHQAAGGRVERRLRERLHAARPGTPRDVEARYRIAMAVGPQIATLGPADGRQEGDPVAVQPGSLLPSRPLHIGTRPTHGPGILVIEPVERCTAAPVVPREFERVSDAHPPLFGAVHDEQATERPERLATQVGGVLLVDERDFLASAGQFMCGHQARQPRADDDDIRAHPCPVSSPCLRRYGTASANRKPAVFIARLRGRGPGRWEACRGAAL